MKYLRVFGGVVVAVLVCAPAAFAGGGASIASAPSVAYGQQEFGNTATDYGSQTRTGQLNGDSWWQLQAIAGDRITVDWEGDASLMEVWPVGTTDYNVNSIQLDHQLSPFVNSSNGSNGKMETVFTAPRDGAYPLEFQTVYCCNDTPPGPYDFTAYDQHRLVLSLGQGRTNRRLHNTRFVVGVHSPDGAVVNNANLRYKVERLSHSRWVTLSTLAQPFAFSLKWPRGERGKWQRIRVQVFGSGYLTATSQVVRAKAG
jgi:hypothetical protein